MKKLLLIASLFSITSCTYLPHKLAIRVYYTNGNVETLVMNDSAASYYSPSIDLVSSEGGNCLRVDGFNVACGVRRYEIVENGFVKK